MKTFSRTLVLLVAVAGVAAFFGMDLGQFFSLQNLKEKEEWLRGYYADHRLTVIAGFTLTYVASVALSLPIATVLTLAGGAIFGVWLGALVVVLSATVGATLAFLGSRFLLHEWVQSRFADKFESLNEGFKREGAFYLFTLRLVPLFPFFGINLAMGLTPIKTVTFFIVSLVAMVPGTLAYANAGTQLSKINSAKDILSWEVLLSFAVLGVVPLVGKKIVEWLRSRRALGKYRKPAKFDYNLVVIGGGSAGLVSAYIASAVKAKVALIEKHRMGGDCLNTGCVPSKAFIRSARIFSYIRRAAEFGLGTANAATEFSQVMERVQRVIRKVEPHDSAERYSALGVDCISGEAKIRTPFEIEVNGKTLTTRSIIVATGAGPFVPPIPGLNEMDYLTSDNVWQLRALPKRLVVLGGGPIGCELAQSFARFGSQVTQVEMLPRIMSREDEDVSRVVSARFEADGVRILAGHKAKQFLKAGSAKVLLCEYAGKEVRIEFDEVLVALGRRANTKGFGLEDLGVTLSKRGTIESDPFLRTNLPNLYVCGDVAGPYQFTHTAAHQAWYAAVNALFSPFKSFRADYRVIPWCTFTDPEVARVGLNELEAKEKKVPYEVTRYEIDDLDRAIAEEEAYGFIKVLTVPGKDKILGVTIVGHHAGEVIAEYVSAMKHGIGLNKILGTIHIYPTLTEANKYVAGNWKRAHAPAAALRWLEKFHAFRRA